MAENERLDVLKSQRWLRVMRHIASSPQEPDIVRRLTEAMYRTLRSVGKQIPLEDLLKAAANRRPNLSAEVALYHHDFAEMIERVTNEPVADGGANDRPTIRRRNLRSLPRPDWSQISWRGAISDVRHLLCSGEYMEVANGASFKATCLSARIWPRPSSTRTTSGDTCR